jgi:hypothetical protein
VEVGSKLGDDAGNTMTDIVTQVKRVSDLIGEISSSTKEQRAGITQVGQVVSHPRRNHAADRGFGRAGGRHIGDVSGKRRSGSSKR